MRTITDHGHCSFIYKYHVYRYIHETGLHRLAQKFNYDYMQVKFIID